MRAVILVKFIAAMAAAIAAFGTAVFSWAGAALVVEEAGVNSGLIWAAIGALTAALGTQAQQLIGLHGETIDNSTFPGGHWPDPIAGSFNDGSVKDGHADWSLNKQEFTAGRERSVASGRRFPDYAASEPFSSDGDFVFL